MNDFNELIQTLAVYASPVIFAITLHESAHAYVASYLGDNTARAQGRLSLNPMKHLDPMGTVVIPALLYAMTGGAFIFGYAKPVPVDYSKLKNPKRDMAWVALAGPSSNLLMGLLWMAGSYVLAAMQINEPFLVLMAQAGVISNLVMFALNLFPMPPLDGGRILVGILPMKQAVQVAKIEPYGFFIVLGLMVLKLFNYWLIPVMVFGETLYRVLLSPLRFLIN